MVDITCVVTYLMFLSSLQLAAGQLPDTESLKNITTCDLKSELNITCGTDESIVIHSIKLAYNVKCVGTCCNIYNSSDCFADFDADVTREFRRACSGHQTCTAPSIQNTADFCAFGVQDVSYAFLEYYCIPESRTLAMCTTGAITSKGPPLYITSANYPGVTIGSTSCACSIEVNSCSSSITLYEADIDLYLDTSNCKQNVVFKNGTDSVLTTFGCESYDTEYITNRFINSHYSKIEFNNNSTANQEGLYFLGLKASEDGVSFTLSCTSVSQSWCVGCGPLQNIANGIVELRIKDDTSYGSIADVSCNNGYETNTPTISCQENNTWPDPICIAKAACTAGQWRCTNGDCIADSGRCDNIPECTDDSDEQNCQISPSCPEGWESCQRTNGSYTCVEKAVGCCGPVPAIENGAAVLSDNTSIANIVCNEGYEESIPTITCLPSRVWELATCSAVDCGPAPTVEFGNVTLGGTTTFESKAIVACETGYQPSKTTITCLAAGEWETPKCNHIVSRSPTNDSSHKLKLIYIIVIVIAIVLLLSLTQASLVTAFECKHNNIRKRANEKQMGMPKLLKKIGLAVIPMFGFIFVYRSWNDLKTAKKTRREIYNKGTSDNNIFVGNMNISEQKNGQNNSQHQNSTVSNSTNLHESINTTSNKVNRDLHVDHITFEDNEDDCNSQVLPQNNIQHQDRAISSQLNSFDSNKQSPAKTTMTRGASALLGDPMDDMDLVATLPTQQPETKKKQERKKEKKKIKSDGQHHHFPLEVEQQRQGLQPVIDKARKQGKHADLVRDELYINNRLYQPEMEKNTDHNTVTKL